jgi:hypothetical protein
MSSRLQHCSPRLPHWNSRTKTTEMHPRKRGVRPQHMLRTHPMSLGPSPYMELGSVSTAQTPRTLWEGGRYVRLLLPPAERKGYNEPPGDQPTPSFQVMIVHTTDCTRSGRRGVGGRKIDLFDAGCCPGSSTANLSSIPKPKTSGSAGCSCNCSTQPKVARYLVGPLSPSSRDTFAGPRWSRAAPRLNFASTR